MNRTWENMCPKRHAMGNGGLKTGEAQEKQRLTSQPQSENTISINANFVIFII